MGRNVGLEEAGGGDHQVGELLIEGPILERLFTLLLGIHHLACEPGAARAAREVLFDRIYGTFPAGQGHVTIEAGCRIVMALHTVILEEAGGGHVFRGVVLAMRPVGEGLEPLLEGRHGGVMGKLRKMQ